MKRTLPRTILLLLACTVFLQSTALRADVTTASQAMEDQQHPLLLINTSVGEIYVEMFPEEAPDNVANFIALAAGDVELSDAATGTRFKPRYFDGVRFHRVIPGFIIQAASPHYHPLGSPAEILDDEINADYLGLDQQPVLSQDGSFNPLLNIQSKDDFQEQILEPLYQTLNIETEAELADKQFDVLAQLQTMTVKRAYQNQGYRYQANFASRQIVRGIVALANTGPDSNGPEFFINLAENGWLSGKYTVIGKVVEGMDIADVIGNTPIDPLRSSRRSTVIYSVRQLN